MIYLELAPARRQKAWGWPAVVNLTLGGAGAGLYVIGFFLSFISQAGFVENQRIPYQILAPVITGMGFLSLIIEVGKPLRGLRIFRNINSSWMSVESLSAGIFIVMALASWLSLSFIFHLIAAVAALFLMTSQGAMVFHASAVKAWNQKVMPVLFLASGLMSACGLILLNTAGRWTMDKISAVHFILVILLNFIVWLLYLFGNREISFKHAVKHLSRTSSLAIIGIGHLIPFALLLPFAFAADIQYSAAYTGITGLLSGVVLICCGAAQKAGLIIAAGYYRSMTLQENHNR